MQDLSRAFVDFLRSEDGPTSVEYAVMLAMIITACVVTVGQVGTTTNNLWEDSASKL